MSNIIDSVNNNNVSTSQDIYNSYNNFIFSNDIKIFGKLMLRNSFFEKIKNIPGDIVEVGVFKGSGVTSWLKMIKLHCGQSNKKVVKVMVKKKKEKINLKVDQRVDRELNLNRSKKFDKSIFNL